MFHYVLDANEGVLVSRNSLGAEEPQLVDRIESAICALDRAPVRVGMPKLHLCVIDTRTATIDAAGRDRLGRVSRAFQSPRTHFAMVTTSGIARATFAVMKFLIPHGAKLQIDAFGTLGPAIDWLESARPGGRTLLTRLYEQLDNRVTREAPKGEALSFRTQRT